MKALSLLVKPASALCNMNCTYCFYNKLSENKTHKIMEKSTVNTLIEKIFDFSPDSLFITFQGGEPTLAGIDFFNFFVSSLKEKNTRNIPVNFAFQTNGLLIDDRFAEFFKEHSFLVGISLDGNRKTNDRYRKSKNGQSVLPEVLQSIDILKKHSVQFNILSVITDESAKEIDSTYAYFKKHGFNYIQFIPFVDENTNVSLSAENYTYFLKRSFDLWFNDLSRGKYVSIRHIDNFLSILLGRPPENCAMCGVCGNYFVVEADGELFPCDFYCKNEYSLGTVFEKNPFELKDKQKDFIAFSRLIHPHCKTCKYFLLCRGGCRRDRNDDGTKNKYCQSYFEFFEYAYQRLVTASRFFNNG